MSGQWKYSDRRARLPRGWQRIRRQALERDGYLCQAPTHVPDCDGRATDVDHVDRDGGDGLHNLRSLSGPCHRAKSAREGVAARGSTKRPREPHPGLLPPQ